MGLGREGGSVSPVPRRGKRTPALRHTSESPRNRPATSPVLRRIRPGRRRVESDASPLGVLGSTRCERFEGRSTRTLPTHGSQRTGAGIDEGSSAVCSGTRLWDPNSGIPPSKVRKHERHKCDRSRFEARIRRSRFHPAKESNSDARRPR